MSITSSSSLSDAIGKSERITQNRVVSLFQHQLGYIYLGNLEDKPDNSNIDEALLTNYLRKHYCPEQISRALYALRSAANNPNQKLYNNNKAVYSLLRYGVDVKTQAGSLTDTVQLINWTHPEQNDFYIAEEVTIYGNHEKRPDIVLYVNGIAIAVLELKNSRVSIGEGIRQSLVNQQSEFIGTFFSTVQFIFAGNDSEGLQYGTTGTEEKFFLKWKEDEQDNQGYKLDKYLAKIGNKQRLIELMHDFVLFDGGIKKLPCVHQYFGIKAAQEHVRRRESGILWHTQGSGKSMLMVLLAKWILENNPQARVVVITDRDALDKQIKRVFTEAGEQIEQAKSGRDLMTLLGSPSPRLICSLVHKFGKKEGENFEHFINELESQPTQTVGELFVFVDECHRTQSGRFHRVMKALLPNAVFIGFTGTPLLKKDKATSQEVFGKYIHTYKYNEAVEDGVVLDLVYEARDIDQTLTSPKRVDEWFAAKTRGLNDFQQSELKKQWGTMQRVLSSRSRLDRVVEDIIFDFSVKLRLNSDAGNAILVASSIFEACRYYALFQATFLKNKCAVITSYNPLIKDISTEDTGANTETDKEIIYRIYSELLKEVAAKPGMTKTESYEETAKELFLKQPANMKLLIVVDKLLTGFDAPACTYLYIDKQMQDHGLFQAICRVNRLDSEDKLFGYIVDYKKLFSKVENAVAVYTSELDYDEFKQSDSAILLKTRLEKGRERLDAALEQLALLCEPVRQPKAELDYMHYFCGNTEIPSDLKEHEVQRTALYKSVVSLIRAYANIADEMQGAGYSTAQITDIKKQIDHYLKLREVIRRASDEVLDLKKYEVDMRLLIDNYIQADVPEVISSFAEMSLIDIIVNSGISAAINAQSEGIKSNKEAVAETIENNVRSKIIKDHLLDPAYFEKMSVLLDEIIKMRKQGALAYEKYLDKIAELAKQVAQGHAPTMPVALDTQGKRAIYNNLGEDEQVALVVHQTMASYAPDNWKGNRAKELIVKGKLLDVLGDAEKVEAIFPILKQQNEY